MALTTIFPKLVSLEAEYDDGSRKINDLDTTVSEALLNVSGTLENLSLTTSPEASWSDENVLPQLLNLNRMIALEHLTTESIWLFGRGESFTTLQLLDILPGSLVRFHLIDYWGNSNIDAFCPHFPNALSLLGFYDQLFSTLHKNYSTRLHNFRDITLALHFLSSRGTRASSGNTTAIADESNGQDIRADIRAFSHKFQNSFASVGIRFSVVAPETLEVKFQSSWANVG